METNIITQPNQSLLDVILARYGTLEAGMAAAIANDVPVSYIPLPGTILTMPHSELADPGNVQQPGQQDVVPGTLSMPLLSCTLLLRPVLDAVPTVTGNPHVIGYYQFEMRETDAFFHAHALGESYPGTNRLQYVTEERYLTGHTPETVLPMALVPMPEKRIPYRMPWTVGFGYMMAYADLTEAEATISFNDTDGNEAFFSPVVVLDNTTQEILDVLCGRIEVAVVAANVDAVTMKVTRMHPAIHVADFATYEMEWTHAAVGGSPDPADPDNDQVTIVTLPPGKHILGIKTTYLYIHTTPITAFPASGCSVVIGIQ